MRFFRITLRNDPVIAGGLVTLGAAAWTLWVAFAVTGLHLGYLTWYLRRRPAPASS